MRVHHLNCGTLRLPFGRALGGTGRRFSLSPAVIHCVLVETDDGLLLVDTGFGIGDCVSPTLFMRAMMAVGGSSSDVDETALMQLARLGYAPEDVHHIVLTHFHYDHAGGLPDFPGAHVHIYRDEYEAVTSPVNAGERYPYRREHRSHGPDWTVHDLRGDRWFGFDCTAPVDLGSTEFRLVPLPGHTRGHSGVALRLPDGWLFHCGDAYVYHCDVDRAVPDGAPLRRHFGPLVSMNKSFRAIGQHAPRLRSLVRAHGDEVRLICSHDPWDLARCAAGGQATQGRECESWL